MLVLFFMQMWADHLPTNHWWSVKTDQLHLGSLQLSLEAERRKHSWHRRWVSCTWNVVRFWLPRGQERRGKGNTNTKICIVQRGKSASFSLMKQLEMITVSSTAQTTTQDRCEESCINLAQDKVYERMQSRELKTTLSAKLKQPSPHCWLLFCLLVSHF